MKSTVEKLLKELCFMCLMSDNVIESPYASNGVKDTAFKLLRPLIRLTADNAVEIMIKVVQKKEVSVEVNHFFSVAHNILGEDIYQKILFKIAKDDGMSKDDVSFMLKNYQSVSVLNQNDYMKILEIHSKKININNNTADITQTNKIRLLPRFMNLPTFAVVLNLFNIFLQNQSSHNQSIERTCDIRPQVDEGRVDLRRRTSADETVKTTVHERDVIPPVSLSYSVEPYYQEIWYNKLLARDRPLHSSLLEFADMDDLFPKSMPSLIMETDDSTVTVSTPASMSSAEQHTSESLNNEQASFSGHSTSVADLMHRLSKRQGTPVGALVCNVNDLFSENELRPAFEEDTAKEDENAIAVEPPEEFDSTNGLGDFEFRSGYSLNFTRLYPIKTPDGILEDLEKKKPNEK